MQRRSGGYVGKKQAGSARMLGIVMILMGVFYGSIVLWLLFSYLKLAI